MLMAIYGKNYFPNIIRPKFMKNVFVETWDINVIKKKIGPEAVALRQHSENKRYVK